MQTARNEPTDLNSRSKAERKANERCKELNISFTAMPPRNLHCINMVIHSCHKTLTSGWKHRASPLTNKYYCFCRHTDNKMNGHNIKEV